MEPSFPPELASWLRRANRHPLRERLLLSGSALIAALCPHARRPDDIDYVVTGVYDVPLLEQMSREIVATADARGRLTLIRSDAIFEYPEQFPGMRVQLAADGADFAARRFLVDFTFGDPLVVPPRPVTIPGVGAVPAVAPESLFAWKIHALVQFGEFAWRPKDLLDIGIMWREAPLDRSRLPYAIDVAFSSRGDELADLDMVRHNPTWGLQTGAASWQSLAHAHGVALDFRAARAELRDILDELL